MGERPILFSAPMVRALLAGSKTQTRRVLTMNNSTVLGDRWGRNSPWDGLDFANAVPRTQSTLMRYIAGSDAPRDIHLDVPFLHPEDAAAGMEWDGCVYRVRPQWETGETLWVKERIDHLGDEVSVYAADMALTVADAWPWKRNTLASIHCPRGLSRITLKITDVRVERLTDISEADAWAEGVEPPATEREDHNWSICPACGGTGLHGALGEHLGYVEVDCTDCDTAAKRYRHLWESINGRGSWAANPFVWAVSFEVIR